MRRHGDGISLLQAEQLEARAQGRLCLHRGYWRWLRFEHGAAWFRINHNDLQRHGCLIVFFKQHLPHSRLNLRATLPVYFSLLPEASTVGKPEAGPARNSDPMRSPNYPCLDDYALPCHCRCQNCAGNRDHDHSASIQSDFARVPAQSAFAQRVAAIR